MTYSLKVILKAAELAELPSSATKSLISKLEEALLVSYSPVLNNLEDLLREVCNASNISVEQAKSGIRRRKFVYARQTFSVLAKELFPNETLEVIGSYINLPGDMIVYYQKGVDSVREKQLFYKEIRTKLGL